MNFKDTTFNLFLPSRVYFFGSNNIPNRKYENEPSSPIRRAYALNEKLTTTQVRIDTLGLFSKEGAVPA